MDDDTDSPMVQAYRMAERAAVARDATDEAAADAFRDICDVLWYGMSDDDRDALRKLRAGGE